MGFDLMWLKKKKKKDVIQGYDVNPCLSDGHSTVACSLMEDTLIPFKVEENKEEIELFLLEPFLCLGF